MTCGLGLKGGVNALRVDDLWSRALGGVSALRVVDLRTCIIYMLAANFTHHSLGLITALFLCWPCPTQAAMSSRATSASNDVHPDTLDAWTTLCPLIYKLVVMRE